MPRNWRGTLGCPCCDDEPDPEPICGDCLTVPTEWRILSASITNGSCTNCAGILSTDQILPLLGTSPCIWELERLYDVCGVVVQAKVTYHIQYWPIQSGITFDQWRLDITYHRTAGSQDTFTYNLARADFDCLATNTMNLIASGPSCSFPSTIQVEPA